MMARGNSSLAAGQRDAKFHAFVPAIEAVPDEVADVAARTVQAILR
jgi:hypothetical protein